MIYHFNTIFSGMTIGEYYNRCCEIVPDDEWICLWDADVMSFHFFDVNGLLERVIKENPDVRLFSCVANRIGTHKQRVMRIQDPNPSILYHRKIAGKRYEAFGSKVRKDLKTLSGLMMLFPKNAWRAVGGFQTNDFFGVDTDFSQKIHGKYGSIAVLEGLYVLHYYRFDK